MFGFGGRIETLIGEGASLEGDLHVPGAVFVNGRIKGDLGSDELITLGENAEIEGDLRAPVVVVGGKLRGQIFAMAKVQLLATAKVAGDIVSPRLHIEEGALFEGSCEMAEPGAARAATVEFKQHKK